MQHTTQFNMQRPPMQHASPIDATCDARKCNMRCAPIKHAARTDATCQRAPMQHANECRCNMPTSARRCNVPRSADATCKDARCNMEQATCGDATCSMQRRTRNARRRNMQRAPTRPVRVHRGSTQSAKTQHAPMQHTPHDTRAYAGALGKLARRRCQYPTHAMCNITAKPTTALVCTAAPGVSRCNNDATINATYNTRRATTQPTTDHPDAVLRSHGPHGVVTVHEARSTNHQWGDNTARQHSCTASAHPTTHRTVTALRDGCAAPMQQGPMQHKPM
jgi:hypothetical protein